MRTLSTPAYQVRTQLERLRQQGLPFEFAWKRALERVKWPEDKAIRDEWKASLAQGKISIWRAAYYREGESPKGMDALTGNVFLPEPGELIPERILA